MMSLSTGISSQHSQEPQENELVRRRPLLTKQFIPNQEFQQASTSNEETQLPIICDLLKQNKEPTIQQGSSSEKQASQITEGEHIRKTPPRNTTSNFANNLFKRDSKRGSKKKISKKVKLSERNKKLMKTLQPKCASQILNELVTTNYCFEELRNKDKFKWRAIVLTNGMEYEGYGRTKVDAKNNVAEVALKDIYHQVQNCFVQEAYYHVLLWQQITCYALFKLLSSWSNVGNNYSQNQLQLSQQIPDTNYYEPQIIPSPEKMDPILLIKKMLATFEEVPHGFCPKKKKKKIYLFKCNVGDDSFFGTGDSKIMAKRMAAYEACTKVIGVKYPRSIYVSNS